MCKHFSLLLSVAASLYHLRKRSAPLQTEGSQLGAEGSQYWTPARETGSLLAEFNTLPPTYQIPGCLITEGGMGFISALN